MDNLYRALNLSPTASGDDIRETIKRELRVWSNRQNAPQIERRQEAERMVKMLEGAESILLDPAKRTKYDRELAAAPSEGGKAGFEVAQGAEQAIEQGWRLLIDGRIADAMYVGTEATKRDGDNPEAWALLAQSKFRWGDIEDAIYEYKRAISLKPNVASYYFDLGSVYESAKRWSDALQQYERASKIDPQVTAYRAAIGILFVRNEVYGEGIKILERCRQEEPDNATYQWFMAIAYQESAYEGWTQVGSTYLPTRYEHIEAAQEHLRKARALKFDDPDLARHLGEVEESIASMTKKKFVGNLIPPILWALLGLFMMGSAPAGGFFFIAIPALYVASCFTPQYKINDRIVQGKNINAGVSGAWLLGIVIMPFVTIYNFIRNYATK